MSALTAIDRPAIEAAAALAGAHLRVTPVLRLPAGSLGVPCPLALKLEFLQVSGSFKGRGAMHSVLRGAPGPAGVLAASGGNHGIAVAYAARAQGVRAEVFVPTISAPAKVETLRSLGAEVVVTGADYAEALAASQARAAETGALVIHAFDQVNTVLGAATLAREFATQAPDVETFFVAVGGGGLLGGMAGWFREDARLVGVEPELAPTLFEARRAGSPVDVAVSGVAADALGARRIGGLGFELAEAFVEDAVLVEDAAIVAAQRRLWRDLRVAVEPAAAAALAGLTGRQGSRSDDQPVGLILCGANVAPGSVTG